MIYTLIYHKNTVGDKLKLKAAKLLGKTDRLCTALSINPTPLNSKELSGDLKGKRSIRINLQHRLVYEIFEKEKIIKILKLWGHYE
jgi:toxin YoeB